MCFKGEATISDPRLLSVSRQVRAQPWSKYPLGGLQLDLVSQLSAPQSLEVESLPLSQLTTSDSTLTHFIMTCTSSAGIEVA